MADASFGNMEFDPVTGQMKQKKQPQQPYLNPNGANQGILPYTGGQQQQATPNTLEQGNANVMGAAQNAALNQQNPQNNQIRNQAGVMTQNLMKNPSMGMDWAKYNTGQLSQYDANAALAAQKAKQELGGMGGAGQVQQNLINMMMQQNTDRSGLDNTLQKEAYQNQKTDTYDALNQGLTTSDSFDKSQSTAIDNLLKVRSGYEGERSQDSSNTQQMSVLDKTFGQDMAKLITSQDWSGVQNQLDREAAIAKQSNDINAQKTIQERQIAADIEQLKSTQDFTGIQADIDRKWKEAENTQDRSLQDQLSLRQEALDKWKVEKQIASDADILNKTQNFAAVQADIDRAWKTAESTQDRALQSSLVDRQIALDKWTLENTQNFEAIQNDIQNKWQSAENSSDRTLQNSIVQRQLDLDKWKQENGQAFTAEQNALNRALEITLQDKDATAQKDILGLKARLDKGLLVQQQQFDAVQNNLDRQLQQAATEGNWKNAVEITKLKGEIDKSAQDAQNRWNSAEREANQSWQTSERVETDKAEQYMQLLDQKHEIAVQSNDIQAKKDIEDTRSKLQLKLQTQEMSHEQSMAYLTSELDNAKANGDVERQLTVLKFTHAQELDKIQKEQGFEKSMAYLDNNLKQALQTNDFYNAQALQEQKYVFESVEKEKDRQLEQASLDLEKQGVDMARLDAEYEKLQSLVDSGTLDPLVLKQFVDKTLSTAGISLKSPDPQASQKEAQQKMTELKYQFGTSHPELVDTNGNLKPEGTIKFNEFYNSSVYGELTAEEKEAKKNAGKLGAEDLQYGDVGDVFNIDKETTFNGQKIPPGEYRVKNADYSKGSKFWGTKKNYTKRILVDSNGKEVATLKDIKSGNEGNIISNLWAGDINSKEDVNKVGAFLK